MRRTERGFFESCGGGSKSQSVSELVGPSRAFLVEKPEDICGVVGTYAATYERARFKRGMLKMISTLSDYTIQT